MPPRRVLLVEGKDDLHVVLHLCEQRGVTRPDEIVPHEGADRLLEALPLRLKESDVETLGVMLDADTNLAERWQSVATRLRTAGFTDVPLDPEPTGTILAPPTGTLLPRVGVWLMPDNATTGILEDFLRFLVPAESPLYRHVESSVESIPPAERRFNDSTRPKALIHTWLAWQKKPGKPLGTAITASFLDAHAHEADVFVAWVTNLFSE